MALMAMLIHHHISEQVIWKVPQNRSVFFGLLKFYK